MNDRTPLSLRFRHVSVLALGAFLAACSGTDYTGEDPDGVGGAGSSGASGAGATPGSGGIPGSGGATNTGGIPGAGGAPSTGGTSGTTGGSGGGTGPASSGGQTGSSGGSQSGGKGPGGGTGSGGKAGGAGSGGFSTGGASAGSGGKAGATGGGSQGGGAGSSSGGTGGAGSCTFSWEPPATFTSKGKAFPLQASLDQVWEFQSKNGNPSKNQNSILDQIIDNDGSLNYCVQIDLKTNAGGESTVISEAQRTQYQQLLETWINNWVETHMKGWGCWPYQRVPVKIVGWAVVSASTLGGTVDPSQTVYVNQLDRNGIPKCADACSRSMHPDGNYSGCMGGAANHFDMSLWLTYGMGLSGFGGSGGLQMDLDVAKYQHILGHEMGHGFGLPDFYSGGARDFYTVQTGADAQALKSAGFIMQAGSASTVTEFDGWMLRQMWQKGIRERNGY